MHRNHQPIGYHIVLRPRDGRVLAGDTERQRLLAATVRRVGSRVGVWLFRASDNHLHVAAGGSRERAGEAARRLAIGLGRILRLGVSFAESYIRPIADQRHAASLPAYFFRQEKNHGTNLDPFHEASCLPDIVGARVGASWLRDRLRRTLPRLRFDGLTRFLPPVAPPAVLFATDLRPVLHDAVAAAVCVPTLESRAPLVRAAKRAAVAICKSLGTGLGPGIRDALHLSARTATRMRLWPVDEGLVHAIRLQLGMRLAAPTSGDQACAS